MTQAGGAGERGYHAARMCNGGHKREVGLQNFGSDDTEETRAHKSGCNTHKLKQKVTKQPF